MSETREVAMETVDEQLDRLAEKKAGRRVERAGFVGFIFGALTMLVALIYTGAI